MTLFLDISSELFSFKQSVAAKLLETKTRANRLTGVIRAECRRLKTSALNSRSSRA